ncbi:Putative alpha/Beta hydrolase [Septoria linicola]|uniref:Alpha/Beta hydrolase n=1 Tax=Septoria linicola TaxID=215465 RepID=A0A9Q9APS9_9PEZI|nr:putative alpha/Beta hydrolase [Septoria linicola]USW49993.1 Putative alpha/Beta hydrolase [Septoria linicola]
MNTIAAEMTPAQAKMIENRNLLSQWEATLVSRLGPPSLGIEEFYHTMTLLSSKSQPQDNSNDTHSGPGCFIATLKIFRCKSTPAIKRPLIVLFHGGGSGAGSIEMCTRPAREFAEEFGAVMSDIPIR